MVELKDLDLWEQIKKQTKPLVKKQVVKHLIVKDIPIHYKKHYNYVLDLHGYTIQDAYELLQKFMEYHYKNKTKYVTVITGKGTPERESFIHYEIKNWLKSRLFIIYVKNFEWINGNGALKIFLK